MSSSLDSPDTQGQKTLKHEDNSTAAEESSLLQIETNSQPDDDYSWDPQYNSRLLDYQRERGTHIAADVMYASMLGALRGLKLLAADKRIQRLRRIETLIAHDDHELQIDDCIRWWILLKAVEEMEEDSRNEDTTNENIDAEEDPKILIIYIITKVAPHLAFEIYQISGWIFSNGQLHDKGNRCKFPHVHKSQKRQSPFQIAADYGHYKAIRHMLNHGATAFPWGGSDETTHDTFLKILRQPYQASGYKSYSPLRIAAENEEKGLPVVKLLLNFDPDIAAPPDSTFDYALDTGRIDILEVYIQYERLRDMFITLENILRAMELCEARSIKGFIPDKIYRTIYVPSDAVDMIIGKGGETIRKMQKITGCKINVAQLSGPSEVLWEIALTGAPSTIAYAKHIINEIVKAVRQKSSGSGGRPSGDGSDLYGQYDGYQNYVALWYQPLMYPEQQGGGQATLPSAAPPLGAQYIVLALITHMPRSVAISYEIIEKVIELNLLEVWHVIRPFVSELNAGRFLHFAVRHQNAQFVDLFLQQYPDSVAYQWEGKYALWYNNNNTERMERLDPYKWSEYESSEDELARHTIRDMLASAIVKTIPTISDILDVFQKSGVVAKEICLDLSGFQSTTHSMSDLFHGLMNQQDHTNLLSYEHSLRYVEFPALAFVADEKKMFASNIQSEHKEIFEVLEWLHDMKGVKDIWELIVRDRLLSPHNEVEIGKHIGRFNVEALNWKMLDMSITIFEEKSARNIRELCLYASGKRAVISHWLSTEGISSLPRLEVLNIYVIKDLMTKENCRMTFAYLSNKFSELSERINEKRRIEGLEELFVNVNIEGWDPVYEEKLPELEEISERIVPKLSQFTKGYCNLVQNVLYDESCAYRPTRIAIIDNGMLDISSNTDNLRDVAANRQQLDARHSKGKGRQPNDGTLWSRIKEGRSFVDDGNRVSQWFLASDPHGTQMARIIGSVDPCCDLYVARVSSGRSGLTPSRVAKAIRWAISKEVDIISMSFALRQTTDELHKACLEASAFGIAMLCSAHDEGTNLAHAYPADFADTITITTCDEFGTVPPKNRHQSYEFAIDGQNVPVGVVPFLNSGEFVSGSSVATAIAAGLSSLILSCSRLAQKEEKSYRKGQQARIVKRHLHKMAVNESKFIQPEKFAGIDHYINEGRDIDIETIVRQVFLEDLD